MTGAVYAEYLSRKIYGLHMAGLRAYMASRGTGEERVRAAKSTFEQTLLERGIRLEHRDDLRGAFSLGLKALRDAETSRSARDGDGQGDGQAAGHDVGVDTHKHSPVSEAVLLRAARLAVASLPIVQVDMRGPATDCTGRNGGNGHGEPENYLPGDTAEFQGLAEERLKFIRARLQGQGKPVPDDSTLRAMAAREAEAVYLIARRSREHLVKTLQLTGVDCDLHQRGWVRSAANPSDYAGLQRGIAPLKAVGANNARMVPPDEVVETWGIEDRHRLGARVSDEDFTYHPYKLACGLEEAFVARGGWFYAGFKVTDIAGDDGDFALSMRDAMSRYEAPYSLSSQHVFCATNTGTGALFPELEGTYQPVQSQMVTGHVRASSPLRKRLYTLDTRDQGYGYGGIRDDSEALYDRAGRPKTLRVLWGGDDIYREHGAPLRENAAQTARLTREARAIAGPGDFTRDAHWAGMMAYSVDQIPVRGQHRGVSMVCFGNGFGTSFMPGLAKEEAKIFMKGRGSQEPAMQDALSVFSLSRLMG
jgi:hypothetical protein